MATGYSCVVATTIHGSSRMEWINVFLTTAILVYLGVLTYILFGWAFG